MGDNWVIFRKANKINWCFQQCVQKHVVCKFFFIGHLFWLDLWGFKRFVSCILNHFRQVSLRKKSRHQVFLFFGKVCTWKSNASAHHRLWMCVHFIVKMTIENVTQLTHFANQIITCLFETYVETFIEWESIHSCHKLSTFSKSE